jgi:hypothetical protein
VGSCREGGKHTHERLEHIWHEPLHESLLHVERFEQAWEARREDRVHAVVVVKSDEEGVYPLQRVSNGHAIRRAFVSLYHSRVQHTPAKGSEGSKRPLTIAMRCDAM